MDVREKLVEQLRAVANLTPPICMYDHPKEIEIFGKKITVYCKPFEKFQGLMCEAADYIANGVTVQEWIPVTERLPERDKEVLLIVHGWEDRLYYTGCLHRQEAERSWLTGIESKASDWKIWGFSYLREPIVTHWMPLPNPPKGE